MRKVDGRLEAEALRPTLFVPMTGAAEETRKLHPDPSNPQAINGSFEAAPRENGFLPGWYYQRQLEWIEDSDAPDGKHFITFTNQIAGQAAHLLQGIPIDGRLIGKVELSGDVRYQDIRYHEGRSFPMIAMTLYDGNRREVGHHWIGPFRDSSQWKKAQKTFRIPRDAREGILRIGLFGATGQISFDRIKIHPHPR
jgi:protein-L-isoaspartate(D-aspartate) O-methyltransferase